MTHPKNRIQLVYFLRRRRGMTVEEFRAYWLQTHGPLVVKHAETLGIRRYAQIHPHAETKDLFAERNGLVVDQFDGVAEITYDAHAFSVPRSEAQLEAAQELLEDERRFIELSVSPMQLGNEHVLWSGKA